jgi:hypothetical protein
MSGKDFFRIKKKYDESFVENIEQEILQQFERENIASTVALGAEIAITAGSRGIAHITEILSTVIKYFKEIGTRPFIVPAMGSHGGATAAGQVEVLESLGITEDSLCVPIRSSMDVVEIGKTASGCPVFMDAIALHADAIFVVNRVKVHTRFKADHESGLLKMISVGLGKKRGCSLMHEHGLYPVIRDAARVALSKAPIIGALGIVENSTEKIAKIKVANAENIERADAELLVLEKSLLPSLPLDDIDLLIVEEMGKNISGTGMDTNVIGRVAMSCMNQNETPRIKQIVVLDLHDASHGNALGMGLADIITRRFYEKIDFKATYENVIAANVLERAKMPVIQETDEDAISLALRLSSSPSVPEPKVVYIKNTLALSEMIVSRPVLESMESKGYGDLCPEKVEFVFDGKGALQKKEIWER